MGQILKFEEGGKSSKKYGTLTIGNQVIDFNDAGVRTDFFTKAYQYSPRSSWIINNFRDAISRGENFTYDGALHGNIDINEIKSEKRKEKLAKEVRYGAGNERDARLFVDFISEYNVPTKQIEDSHKRWDFTKPLYIDYKRDQYGDLILDDKGKVQVEDTKNNREIRDRIKMAQELVTNYKFGDTHYGYDDSSLDTDQNYFKDITDWSFDLTALNDKQKSQLKAMGIFVDRPKTKEETANVEKRTQDADAEKYTSNNFNESWGTLEGDKLKIEDQSLLGKPDGRIRLNGHTYIKLDGYLYSNPHNDINDWINNNQEIMPDGLPVRDYYYPGVDQFDFKIDIPDAAYMDNSGNIYYRVTKNEDWTKAYDKIFYRWDGTSLQKVGQTLVPQTPYQPERILYTKKNNNTQKWIPSRYNQVWTRTSSNGTKWYLYSSGNKYYMAKEEDAIKDGKFQYNDAYGIKEDEIYTYKKIPKQKKGGILKADEGVQINPSSKNWWDKVTSKLSNSFDKSKALELVHYATAVHKTNKQAEKAKQQNDAAYNAMMMSMPVERHQKFTDLGLSNQYDQQIARLQSQKPMFSDATQNMMYNVGLHEQIKQLNSEKWNKISALYDKWSADNLAQRKQYDQMRAQIVANNQKTEASRILANKEEDKIAGTQNAQSLSNLFGAWKQTNATAQAAENNLRTKMMIQNAKNYADKSAYDEFKRLGGYSQITDAEKRKQFEDANDWKGALETIKPGWYTENRNNIMGWVIQMSHNNQYPGNQVREYDIPSDALSAIYAKKGGTIPLHEKLILESNKATHKKVSELNKDIMKIFLNLMKNANTKI